MHRIACQQGVSLQHLNQFALERRTLARFRNLHRPSQGHETQIVVLQSVTDYCDVAHTLLSFGYIMAQSPFRSTILILAVILCNLSLPGVGGAQEIVELHVSPEVLSLAVGERQRLFFTAFDAQGNIADHPVIKLGTSNALVAKVGPDGTVTGMAPGVATLVVTAGSGTANVRVAVGVGSSGVASAAAGIEASDTLSQRGSTESGTKAVLGGTSRQVVVSPPPSPDPMELSVGESRRFSVRPLGSTYAAATLATWSLSDSAVAHFDVLSGTLRALAPGTTDLIASVQGLADLKWRMTVTLLDLVVAPSVVTMVTGESRSLDATLLTARGETFRTLHAARWSSSNSNVATIDSTGLIRGVDLGSSTMTVTTPVGDSASAMVAVVGDLLLSARGRVGVGASIHQMSLASGTVEPVLFDSATNLYAMRSPSRDAIAFASDARGLYDVYRMESDGSDIQRLTDAEGHHTQPVWSPDGTRIVFTSTRTGTPQLFEMSADGQSVEQLTHGDGSSHSPTMAHDGSTVAFVRGHGNDERVFLMNRDGQNIRSAGLGEPGQPERSPRFFPNGDLAAVVRIGTRATAVVLWDRERDMRLPLVTSNDAIREFAVSRDGRLLVVVIESTASTGKSPTEVLLVDIATRRSTKLVVQLSPGARFASPSF